MSEAMTNSEIEDVLSSIRRLVAQESRSQDPAVPGLPASSPPSVTPFQHRPSFGPVPGAPAPERLVLTAAQRVSEPERTEAPALQDAPQMPDMTGQAGLGSVEDVAAVEAARAVGAAEQGGSGAERSELERTISELESALGHPAAPDEQAQAATGAQTEAMVDAPGFAGPVSETSARFEAPAAPAAPMAMSEPAAAGPSEDDHPLIDEEELAEMISRLVRTELRGQLGEKITLQVRKLVRAEVTKLLDERKLLG